MSKRHPALTPLPLDILLGRVAREWRTRSQIFGLPDRRFYRHDPTCDLTAEVAGQSVGTPLGPAAGPHTQLAQNFVLGWLAGARSFELKTVQILDELEIERPCIDMATIGFNVEWSQELTLQQSLTEYVKAAVMLEVLRGWQPLREVIGQPGNHVFEMSLGYDLAGIQSDRLRSFIAGMRNAAPVIDGLRPHLPEPFTSWRDHAFTTDLASAATISTFHGCPPDEIEAIVRHLMVEHGLDVTVKFNPTLLGRERAAAILRDRLGYHDLELVPEAFAEDLDLDRALNLIDNLDRFAQEQGRTFGIKLTNTLVVNNNRGVLPGERMYLSGQPLHVLAIELLELLTTRLPGRLRLAGRTAGVPVAFSAGIAKRNVTAAVELGLSPVTVCSDLLRPGGYGRINGLLKRLRRDLVQNGWGDLQAARAAADERARRAGRRDAVAAYAETLREADGAEPYSRTATEKPPRTLDRTLTMFDCDDCGNCVTVCPNNAMLALPTPPALQATLDAKRQYFCLIRLCNECGNCTTFCPETGDPCRVKPRLVLDEERFALEDGPVFLLTRAAGAAGDRIAVTANRAAAPQVDVVAQTLAGDAGLPLRARDLAESEEA